MKFGDKILCIKEEHEYHTSYTPTKGVIYSFEFDDFTDDTLTIKNNGTVKPISEGGYKPSVGHFCSFAKECFIVLPEGKITPAITALFLK